MCEQCMTDAVLWSQVLPGWTLMRAREDSSNTKAGQYGLLRSNNPDVVWSSPPEIEPTEDVDGCDTWGTWALSARDFEALLRLRPEVGWSLVEAARGAGYDQQAHGSLAFWLWDHLAKCMKKGWPKHHGTGEEVRT